MKTPIVLETNLAGLAPPKRGKVRDIYDLGDSLLIIATDRISAFDVVLPNAIPEKGRVLTRISEYWFSKTADIVKNHLIATELKDFPRSAVSMPTSREQEHARQESEVASDRVHRQGLSHRFRLKEYRATGSVSGIKLPSGLTEASRLPEPIFTPSTKAEVGEHDINIDFKAVVDLVGKDIAERSDQRPLRSTVAPARSPSPRASSSPIRSLSSGSMTIISCSSTRC